MMRINNSVYDILNQLACGKIKAKEGLRRLKYLPYKNLKFARLDTHRFLRKGFPEVVFSEGKTILQLSRIIKHIIRLRQPLLITRLKQDYYEKMKKLFPKLRYNKTARIAYMHQIQDKKGLVLVITAGTSDMPVGEEAAVTLEIMGNKVKRLYDVGTCGIHRVLDEYKLLESANVIIVIAGMEGALASVIGGLTSKPIIAVPTSVGYGASFRGLSALLTMLNCCAPGVAVVNIDNGFGAGYFASLINK